jgi:hypothetical protein
VDAPCYTRKNEQEKSTWRNSNHNGNLFRSFHKKVFTDQQKDLRLFEEQLTRWSKNQLTPEQRKEVDRLAVQMLKLREQVVVILDLADQLGKGTIEKVMAKSDAELGREFLLNPNKFRR